MKYKEKRCIKTVKYKDVLNIIFGIYTRSQQVDFLA